MKVTRIFDGVVLSVSKLKFNSISNVIRRKKSNPLNRLESMSSLGHRSIVRFMDLDDLPGLKRFLDMRLVQVDDRDENGCTALMVAATKGLTAFARELIVRGANVNAEDFDNWSALLYAAKGGHLKSVEILLGHGADIDHRDMGGWTALIWSSYHGHTAIVSLLLEKHGNVHVQGNLHLGPLLWAAGRGHVDIVQLLVQRGAKVNVGDKYGTTALVWACRKGYSEIVAVLLKAKADVDATGMYSWTPLLVAVEGGHLECVSLLLEHKPNVNTTDQEGMTALGIACRAGYHEIAIALLTAGAYINAKDRSSDTPLIHAVKNGHRVVTDILLKRHADVNARGKDRKTALYVAVEKGHTSIVKLILLANPDLEAVTQDGNTALLRAVRNRNLDIVRILIERSAKVSIADQKGDTCLHIAMRARSKAIVEVILRNPKNSQLLYRANKQGETPYSIDANHQNTVLGQIFGARRSNTNKESEGYELYSSALADVLSEPALTTPINVGLFAKWGSGKSFLLANLREEMKNVAHQWAEPTIKASWILLCVCLHLALINGVAVWLATWSFVRGILASIIVIVIVYLAEFLMKLANDNSGFYWAYSMRLRIYEWLSKLRLILQVAFCHPPGPQFGLPAMPVRFHFAEASNAPPTGEEALGHMLAGLFESIEDHYGLLPTRLYRAFRPNPVKSSSNWRFRKVCSIPLAVLFEFAVIASIIGISMIIIFFYYSEDVDTDDILIPLYVVGGFLLAGILGNLNSWARALSSLFFSQATHLKRSIIRNDGVTLTALRAEVELMTDMVRCLDGFTKQQSRLVGIVDALDSCDTERTLVLLKGLHALLSIPDQPFVLLVAIDPNLVAKTAEAHSRRIFTEGGISGHDFLRNFVHLPLYLDNSGLWKVQQAQKTALARQLPKSVSNSTGPNLHRSEQQPQPVLGLTRILSTNDYFSEASPKSHRRLTYVIYITVRLLKFFQIEFSWRRLSIWINLIEQWPLRASMIILEHDRFSENFDDATPLQTVYDKVRPKIACLSEATSLIDLDRDECQLDAFLQLHKSELLVADLRIFFPFTINLDPYFRKVLKEEQRVVIEDKENLLSTRNQDTSHPFNVIAQNSSNIQTELNPENENHQTSSNKIAYGFSNIFPKDIFHINLSTLSVDGVINLLSKIDDLKLSTEKITPILQQNSISGPVLKYCDLNELKPVLNLSFGHWELFKLLIQTLRKIETQNCLANSLNETIIVDINSATSQQQINIIPTVTRSKSEGLIAKQVILEEQMKYATLETLNREAFEDVIGSDRPSFTGLTLSEVPTIQVAPICEGSQSSFPFDEAILIPKIINNLSGHNSLHTVITMPSKTIDDILTYKK